MTETSFFTFYLYKISILPSTYSADGGCGLKKRNMNKKIKRDHKVARSTKYLLPPLTTPSFASRRQQRKVEFVSKMSSPPFAFETMAFLLLRVTLPFASKLKSYQMTAAASFYQRINSIKFCKK